MRDRPRMARLTPPILPSLLRKRRLALAALWFERLWPAVWPALGVIGGYLCLGLLDVPAMLPPWPRATLFVLTLVAAAFLLWHGLRRFARPDLGAADRRLERDSGLRHRPLSTLADRPAAATPEQEALWREHLSRVAKQVAKLRVGIPRPGLAARDGWALRGALLVGAVACLGVAGPDTWPRLARALAPTWPDTPAGPGTQVQAWITPPAYTGLPPVILRPDTPEARVPAGSHATVSVTGGSGTPDLAAGDAAAPFQPLDAASWQAEADLGKGANGRTRLAITRHGDTLATWALTLIPDQPPVPAFTDPPGPVITEGRRTQQTRMAWQAVDDYGVTQVQIELRLRDRPDAPPLVVPGPVAGSPKSAHGLIVTDLTANPWAGLAVTARVIAKDAPGQIGESADAGFVLPERTFHHPVARALIAIRRQLSLTPEDRGPARTALDNLADTPEAFDNATGILLNLRTISALLYRGHEPDTVSEAQDRMWTLALALEENETERTAQALEQARQSLRDATDPNRDNPNLDTPADRAELDRKVQELRDAIQRHLDALAEQARREGAETPFDPSQPQMNARELDRRAQELQQALNEGRTEDAKREMAELEKLLDQLKNARPETAEARARRREEQRQRGRDQMSAVQDMVQREGELLDHSENRATSPAPPRRPQSQQQPGQQQPGQQQPSQQQSSQNPNNPNQSQPGPERTHDNKSQQAMRRALGELMQRYGDLTGAVPEPLGQADQAMRDAAQALSDGRDAAAGQAARRAIEALQKGGQQMGQQITRQFGTGQQQGEGDQGEDGQNGDAASGNQNGDGATAGQQPGDNGQPGRRAGSRLDPLGRPLRDGASGTSEAGDVRVPDEMEQARTREIQDELRRRGAERTRPQPELDYIDRLLRPSDTD